MLLFSPNIFVFSTALEDLKIKVYKTIILPIVSWSLTLGEEGTLRVLENRNLRRVFELKGDENGEWLKLRNEEVHSLYRSPNIVRVIKSRRLRWAGHVARMEENRSVFKILTGTPAGKIPLGRPREDIIRMDLKEIGINTRNWDDSAQNRDNWRGLLNAALELRVP